MLLRAAGVDGLARFRPSTPLIRSLVVLLAAISLAGPQVAHAADAAANVLKKMNSLYTNARSYEGTVTVHNSGKSPQNGQAYSVTSVQHVRYKSPNLIKAEISMTGTGAAAQASRGGQTLVSDGHTLYRYSPAMKQYMKSPAPPKLTLLQALNLPNFDPSTAKLAGATTINGRAAYEVDAKPGMPTLPAGIPAQQKAQFLANMKKQLAKMKPIRLAIDKQNGQILRVTLGANTIAFSGQTFDPSLSASMFTFAPPAGAKEFTMPAPPGSRGPGGPGAPPGLPPGGRKP